MWFVGDEGKGLPNIKFDLMIPMMNKREAHLFVYRI